ncbi:hypothetical protein VV01_18505 [Luteipulveratus halotolerans]|uniref:RNA polymerase sigma factor n=2 Tax=Luteipulveratus halotolerans TaxID=1631356 RepID=A0A0L6CPY3_9MICO|nr:hypothetical protein VV01_18505 [Luteipulveratus halotolerans]
MRTALEPDTDAERLLAEAVADDDPIRAAQLREQVVTSHRRVAISLARRFAHRGIEPEDLEQVALLGLVLAARRYRPDRGPGFLAYAVPTITGEIKRHFRDHGWAVRPPRALQETHRDVRVACAELEQTLGREPTVAEISEAVGEDRAVVRDAQRVDGQYRSVSLDRPPGPATTVPLGETLASDRTEHDLADVEAVVSLRPALRSLSDRERTLLRLRFVDNLTQREIGRRIGVSQMQVSRLLGAVLRRLRREMGDDGAAAVAG